MVIGGSKSLFLGQLGMWAGGRVFHSSLNFFHHQFKCCWKKSFYESVGNGFSEFLHFIRECPGIFKNSPHFFLAVPGEQCVYRQEMSAYNPLCGLYNPLEGLSLPYCGVPEPHSDVSGEDALYKSSVGLNEGLAFFSDLMKGSRCSALLCDSG